MKSMNTKALDGARIRADFPILDQEVRGKRLVYLDSAATAQKPRAVIDALRSYYEHDNANVHRGVHTLAERATDAFEGARARVARFLGAEPDQLVWTRNATEAINLVARAFGPTVVREGDTILVTILEHHANLVPWQQLAAATGARIEAVPIREDFTLDPEAFHRGLEAKPRVVAFSMMSNTLGTELPVVEMARAARAAGAVTVLDAAQAAPHQPIDFAALGVDFLAFSGHKMMGPTGIGGLLGTRERLAAMPPFLGGGEMIQEVRIESSTYKAPPHRFEAGTPAIAEAVGLAAAVEYLEGLGMEAVHAYEQALAGRAIAALETVPGLRILGPRTDRGGAVSFVLDSVHAHDLATILDTEGVAVRAGHHCTMPLHRALGVAATTRASFYVYNTDEDVESLVTALDRARSLFARA